MAEYKNLYDFLIEKDNDYDTYDTVWDACVTVCVPYETEGNETDWYDKFCNFILKHVDVVKEIRECECVVDWNSFFEYNLETFRKITKETWGYTPDDEDFICEWIEETHKLLAGYGTESTYHYLMDMFTKNIKDD